MNLTDPVVAGVVPSVVTWAVSYRLLVNGPMKAFVCADVVIVGPTALMADADAGRSAAVKTNVSAAARIAPCQLFKQTSGPA